jgi:hypothetical protein
MARFVAYIIWRLGMARKVVPKGQIQLNDLLKRFPDGFAVSPSLEIYEIVSKSSVREGLPEVSKGGYLAVRLPAVQLGDEMFGEEPTMEMLEAALGETMDALDVAIKQADRPIEVEVGLDLYRAVSDTLNRRDIDG